MKLRKLGGLLLSLLLPLVANAAASVQQDFLDALRATPDVARGEQLFESCTRCHGPQGAGSSDDNVPRIAGQHPRVIIRQLVDYRHDRRLDPQMEAVASRHELKAQDMADLAWFITTLRPQTVTSVGRGEYLDLGRRLYLARCEGCHGARGQGSGSDVVPRLAGQHYVYLLRQFHDALEGRRPLLSRSHETHFKDLDRDALQGLADLLSRMDGVAGQ
jgi:cytochrome c553